MNRRKSKKTQELEAFEHFVKKRRLFSRDAETSDATVRSICEQEWSGMSDLEKGYYSKQAKDEQLERVASAQQSIKHYMRVVRPGKHKFGDNQKHNLIQTTLDKYLHTTCPITQGKRGSRQQGPPKSKTPTQLLITKFFHGNTAKSEMTHHEKPVLLTPKLELPS
jgi:hypothetical protein